MALNYSKKILLINENTRIVPPIKHALNKHGLEIAAEYLNLYSLGAIRKAFARTGKTAFIRAELMRFIKEQGFPGAILMDSPMSICQDRNADPDGLKLLKTFLISYIILSRGADFENLQGNFLLITRAGSPEKKLDIASNPHRILELLRTENQAINSFIDEMKMKKDLFNRLFLIRLLDAESASDMITSQVDDFLKVVSSRKKTAGTEAPESAPEKAAEKPVMSDNDTPATIVYKIDTKTVYEDGQIVEATEVHSSLAEKEFYIMGNWSNKTQLAVSKKIALAVLKGLADRKRFTPAEKVVFNIDDRCSIDGTTALSMAQLFITVLKDYKKIAIVATAKNGEILRKAQGFSMIKSLVTVTV
ncbi:MAG TPA: hypothetical protein PK573_12620 [Spirochaetota bacterium]|nr:hypothetical protein [Spirochaetota bacterium]